MYLDKYRKTAATVFNKCTKYLQAAFDDALNHKQKYFHIHSQQTESCLENIGDHVYQIHRKKLQQAKVNSNARTHDLNVTSNHSLCSLYHQISTNALFLSSHIRYIRLIPIKIPTKLQVLKIYIVCYKLVANADNALRTYSIKLNFQTW